LGTKQGMATGKVKVQCKGWILSKGWVP
jgi:hypothetical protein